MTITSPAKSAILTCRLKFNSSNTSNVFAQVVAFLRARPIIYTNRVNQERLI